MEDTVCICGHWYEEHNEAESLCGGCDAADMDEEDIVHGFQYDPEQNTFQAIADRGGDPDKWPDWMKDDDGRAVIDIPDPLYARDLTERIDYDEYIDLGGES